MKLHRHADHWQQAAHQPAGDWISRADLGRWRFAGETPALPGNTPGSGPDARLKLEVEAPHVCVLGVKGPVFDKKAAIKWMSR